MLYPDLSESFEKISTSVKAVRLLSQEATITVSAGPAVTAKFLAPRLFKFKSAYPNVDVKLNINIKPVSLLKGEADVAIRYGAGQYHGCEAIKLYREKHAPLCAPSLIKSLKSPKQLLNQELLHDDSINLVNAEPRWSDWLLANGIQEPINPIVITHPVLGDISGVEYA